MKSIVVSFDIQYSTFYIPLHLSYVFIGDIAVVLAIRDGQSEDQPWTDSTEEKSGNNDEISGRHPIEKPRRRPDREQPCWP